MPMKHSSTKNIKSAARAGNSSYLKQANQASDTLQNDNNSNNSNNSNNNTNRAIATAIALALEHQQTQHTPHTYSYNDTQSHQSTNFSSITNHRQLAATLATQHRLLQQLEGISQDQFHPPFPLLSPSPQTYMYVYARSIIPDLEPVSLTSRQGPPPPPPPQQQQQQQQQQHDAFTESVLTQQLTHRDNTISTPLEQVAAYFGISQMTNPFASVFETPYHTKICTNGKRSETASIADRKRTETASSSSSSSRKARTTSAPLSTSSSSILTATPTSETATLATLSSVTDTPSNIRQNKAASASASVSASCFTQSSPSNTSNATPIKPKRPLSAYNFFFQQERAKIILQKQQVQDSCNEKPSTTTTHKKKRYQSNGTGFESLAKAISQRWKNVGKDRLHECTRLAQAEAQRYNNELVEYNKLKEKELSALQQAQVASVSEEAWEQYLVSAGAAAESQKSSRKRRRNDTNNDEG